ncbi:MAG: CAP domain-containing protein [Desulfobaccales bacterium]
MNSNIRSGIIFAVFLALLLSSTQTLSARRPPGPYARGVSYLSDLERTIYRFTNEVRQKNGVSPLTWENSLCDVARAHSADMLVRNYFSHNNPEGRSPHERIVAGSRFPLSMTGENIWTSSGRQQGDPRQLARIIVDNWMSSPGHRQNLLHPGFTDIGVGVAARGTDVMVTQVFIRHRQSK